MPKESREALNVSAREVNRSATTCFLKKNNVALA